MDKPTHRVTSRTSYGVGMRINVPNPDTTCLSRSGVAKIPVRGNLTDESLTKVMSIVVSPTNPGEAISISYSPLKSESFLYITVATGTVNGMTAWLKMPLSCTTFFWATNVPVNLLPSPLNVPTAGWDMMKPASLISMYAEYEGRYRTSELDAANVGFED